MPKLPTHAEVLAAVIYIPATGKFYDRKTGKPRTGTLHRSRANTYLRVRICGTRVFAHVLAHFYMTGVWAEQVDHRDLNSLNNAWRNLRAATQSQNSCNRRVRSDSSTGVKGVRRRRDRYEVRLTFEGNNYYLGSFVTLDEAAAAYVTKARELQGEFFYDDNKRESDCRQRVGKQHSSDDDGACVSACDPCGVYDTQAIQP
jgi:AP2 domain.